MIYVIKEEGVSTRLYALREDGTKAYQKHFGNEFESLPQSTGYRLLTEEEWSNLVQSHDDLANHAWYWDNSQNDIIQSIKDEGLILLVKSNLISLGFMICGAMFGSGVMMRLSVVDRGVVLT